MILGKLTVCCGYPGCAHGPAEIAVRIAEEFDPGGPEDPGRLEGLVLGFVTGAHARHGDHPLCVWWDRRFLLGQGRFLMNEAAYMGWPVVEAAFVCEQCGVRWTTKVPAFLVSTFALVGHSRHEGHFMRVEVTGADGKTWRVGPCPPNADLEQAT